jgi:hypothetical protein
MNTERTFAAHYFNHTGEHILDITKILPEDADYFEQNNIKVSMEELRGEIIVYGCPYSDESEESEVIVFAEGRSCEETMAELAKTCKEHFGVA